MRLALARRTRPRGPSILLGRPGSLARQVANLAESLADVLSQAAARGLTVPPVISNCVHDLRGWAHRIDQGSTIHPPAAVDATRVIAYLRGLPDQQLLALLADLPWARLDKLLDAVNATQPPTNDHDRIV